MNHRIVRRVLGALLVLQAIAMAACGAFAYFDVVAGDEEAMRALMTSALITGGCGGALALSAGLRGMAGGLMRREAVAIVGLGWILSGLFGAVPYLLCPPHMDVASAWFEAVSGFTTTGSSAMADIEAWPRGMLLWRATTQWLGGIGILVLFVAVLSFLGVGSKALFQNESSLHAGSAGLARIQDMALLLVLIYLAFSAICTVGLRGMGLSWFNAVCHAMATVSTGGFSPHNSSVGHYSGWGNGWLIESWMVVFMVLCSINFIWFVAILRRNRPRVREEEDARWFVGLLALASVAIAVGVMAEDGVSFWQALRGGMFSVVSITSTTGFGTVDYEMWPAWCQVVLALLMLVGGCAGSTAGGPKIGRIMLFLKLARHEVNASFRPNLVFHATHNGRPVDGRGRAAVVFFLALYLVIGLVSVLVVAALESGTAISLETAASCVLATLSNIGPAFGAVGPTENFSDLRGVTKSFLAVLMILGRLELFAVLALFLPSLWKRYA